MTLDENCFPADSPAGDEVCLQIVGNELAATLESLRSSWPYSHQDMKIVFTFLLFIATHPSTSTPEFADCHSLQNQRDRYSVPATGVWASGSLVRFRKTLSDGMK